MTTNLSRSRNSTGRCPNDIQLPVDWRLVIITSQNWSPDGMNFSGTAIVDDRQFSLNLQIEVLSDPFCFSTFAAFLEFRPWHNQHCVCSAVRACSFGSLQPNGSFR